jgi:penicillin-binding protein 1B
MRRVTKIVLFGVGTLGLLRVVPSLYQLIRTYNLLKHEVVTHFSGRRWAIPSLVYSDSTTVHRDQRLDDIGFFQRLARLNYHRVAPGQVKARGEYSYREEQGELLLFLHSFRYPDKDFSGELVAVKVSTGTLGYSTVPSVRLGARGESPGARPRSTIRAYSFRPLHTIESIEEGTSHQRIDSFKLEPERLGAIFEGDWEQRRLVALSEIPPTFIKAVLAAEDHRFYEHHGLDIARIIKAAFVDLTAGHLVQGGSTLTQQLMKNFFLSSKRDWRRKVKEALMAYIAEGHYCKDEILENYLNDIYFGQRGQEGIYGIWEASESYFSKEPRELTVAEMATVAGAIRSPNRFNPIRHPESARVRRNEVLAAMLHDGYISKVAYERAVTEPVRTREPYTEGNDSPYFLDYVKHELAERYPPSVLGGEGLRVFTTLDIHTEKEAEKAIQWNLRRLEAKHPEFGHKEKSQRLESCLVAIEPQNGRIRAMIGGRDYHESQFNRVTQSKRQPGSTFKPITYLAALQETLDGGLEPFLPTSYIDDSPFTWGLGDDSWTPKNYKDRYFGQVTLEFALAESLNAATARLAQTIGLDRVREMAAKFGFTKLPPYPSMVLGGIEVSPMQLAHMYAILATEGLEVPPYAVSAVVDRDDDVVEGHKRKVERVLSPELAYAIDFMLAQVINHGTGTGAREGGLLRPAAGKTGTTNDSRDAWFAGFTPNLLAVVWTGFDREGGLGLTGAEASLPAWTKFMLAATAPLPESDFLVPPEVEVMNVDPTSGYLAGPYCPGISIEGVFPKGLAPHRGMPIPFVGRY